MFSKPEWRRIPGWWEGIPFWVVFDPNRAVRWDPVLWPNSIMGVDDEELEVLELAGRLAAIEKPRKH